jgi:hypothetical protein
MVTIPLKSYFSITAQQTFTIHKIKYEEKLHLSGKNLKRKKNCIVLGKKSNRRSTTANASNKYSNYDIVFKIHKNLQKLLGTKIQDS